MARRAGSIPEETKRQILEAATAEFSVHGFAKASLRHICAKAGVTTGAMYAYFKDKNELFAHVISPVTSYILNLIKLHYAAELAATTENAMSEEDEDFLAIQQLLKFYYENQVLCQIALQNQDHPAVCAFFDELMDLMDQQTLLLFQQLRGFQPGDARAVINPSTVHWISHLQVDAVFHLISHNMTPASAESQLKEMVRFLRAGFLSLFQAEKTE